jgi:2,4-dienoyl-CoA reductase-like NADH-dependent reductase (Old Yellow Enzyme family)
MLRDLTLQGRAWVAPMCMYSCRPEAPGVVADWHIAHLASFAIGGAPLILTEAAAVTPRGRITPWDAGVWSDMQAEAWRRITDLVHAQGSRIGIQLAHSGRKGSTYPPFHERSGTVPVADGGWETVGPGTAALGALAAPRRIGTEEIAEIVQAYAHAARRSVDAGFDAVEIHGAHGYLLSSFLSPHANDRTDAYGGSTLGRARFLLEVVEAVRAALPDGVPLLVRLSATDWSEQAPGGIEGDVERMIEVAGWLEARGVDLIDVSSGGNVPSPSVPVGPGYQTRFAAALRSSISVPVSAVGMITQPRQAETVLASGQSDVVMMGRGLLADPRWWHRAAAAFRHELPWPGPYRRVLDRHVY